VYGQLGLGKTRGVVTPQMTWRGTAGARRVVLPRRTRAPASRVGGLVYTWVNLDTPLNTNILIEYK
jgi:hypothetical protein